MGKKRKSCGDDLPENCAEVTPPELISTDDSPEVELTPKKKKKSRKEKKERESDLSDSHEDEKEPNKIKNKIEEMKEFLLNNLNDAEEKQGLELKLKKAQRQIDSEIEVRKRTEAERDKLRGQLSLLKELIMNDQFTKDSSEQVGRVTGEEKPRKIKKKKFKHTKKKLLNNLNDNKVGTSSKKKKSEKAREKETGTSSKKKESEKARGKETGTSSKKKESEKETGSDKTSDADQTVNNENFDENLAKKIELGFGVSCNLLTIKGYAKEHYNYASIYFTK